MRKEEKAAYYGVALRNFIACKKESKEIDYQYIASKEKPKKICIQDLRNH